MVPFGLQVSIGKHFLLASTVSWTERWILVLSQVFLNNTRRAVAYCLWFSFCYIFNYSYLNPWHFIALPRMTASWRFGILWLVGSHLSCPRRRKKRKKAQRMCSFPLFIWRIPEQWQDFPGGTSASTCPGLKAAFFQKASKPLIRCFFNILLNVLPSRAWGFSSYTFKKQSIPAPSH